MAAKLFLLCAMWLAYASGQRPGFAGSRPIGYPEVYNRTTTVAADLGNRFGEGDVTTQRLPIEANGDRDLIDRLSKLPVDKQPFWFINWQALEANRNNPLTYPQKPNDFIDPVPNSATTDSNRTPNLNTPNSKTKAVDVPYTNFQSSKSSTDSNQAVSGTFNSTTDIRNRFSDVTTSESKDVGVTETWPTELSATQATIHSTNSKTEHLPTHNHFRPSWITKRFKPRNPIID